MPDQSHRRISGPAVAAFDAQTAAEEAGVLFTPAQWSFVRKGRLDELPTSVPERVTQEMVPEVLEQLVRRCRRSLAHTCPARRK